VADGSRQQGFGFRVMPRSRLRAGEIVVDLFAGGGGASEALSEALGRDPDVCINHDEWAIGMHAANHPMARHLCEDVWQADPRVECAGKAVGWLHASPDCTHFSQAKGGQPRSRATRSLSWVVLKWAGSVRPRIISLENVEQILKWGPLVAKRDKATGRVVRLDGSIAGPDERVPIDEQFLVPDKRREGKTWRAFVAALRGLGYLVESRKVRACDHGAGTSRTRLFMVARRNGEAIRWPEPTHGPGRPQPFVTAADCIDWSIPCPSIFTRKKALADATMRRIARGIKRYVIDATVPFIVPTHETSDQSNESDISWRPPARPARVGERISRTPVSRRRVGDGARVRQQKDQFVGRDHIAGSPRVLPSPRNGRVPAGQADHGSEAARGPRFLAPSLTEFANASRGATWPADEPLRTQCAQVKGGHFALAAATLVQAAHGEGSGLTKRRGSGARAVSEPMGTVTASGGHAIAAATLVQTGYGEREGQAPRVPGLDKPLGTLVDGVKHAAVAAHLVKFRGDSDGRAADQQLPTITSGAGAARPAGCAHALGVVTAFIEQAAGGPNSNTSPPKRAEEPISTITQSGSQQRLVTASMVTMRGDNVGAAADDPLRTLSAGGEHHAVLECTLSPEQQAGALRVAAFLMRYYGEGGQWGSLDDPADTITTKHRLALVTVHVRGTPYVIVDIGLRMLRPPELYRAQGFPTDYIIDRTADGRAINGTRAVRMVGNSVSPPPLRAIAAANLDPIVMPEAVAA
jgi:DNA (cytosine-5)-methyltransferase 1